MAAIVASAEIARSPDDVFAYVTDPTNLPEWQESVVKVECKETPVGVGTSAQLTRRVGKREMTMTSEVVELTPPTHWVIRGVDSPVRGNVDGRIEPLDNGARSRVTIADRPAGTRHRETAPPTRCQAEGGEGDAAQHATPQGPSRAGSDVAPPFRTHQIRETRNWRCGRQLRRSCSGYRAFAADASRSRDSGSTSTDDLARPEVSPCRARPGHRFGPSCEGA